ncbi:hypothetical protein [Neorhodopirellula pilleata]|uniref:Uncharacterized protein n=1 Tax=Neorhodopirellula pilleata TaxID=2714738 RepID=A0A5C6A8K0_9BACT|nr:hypothetical protein [Neorhodopirellula pilleata]TWT95628.1 hypothetical protein Pla100_32690 [Neorhodopirellula pilleata]
MVRSSNLYLGMRLHPFPSDQVSVGIDITTDALRLVALNLTHLQPGDQNTAVEIDVLSTWTQTCDWPAEDLTQWVASLCETLDDQLPESTSPSRTRVALSVPTTWLHFHSQPAQTNENSADPQRRPVQRRPTVSVDEDALFQIASVLDRRGYRVDWVVPDGVAVGLASPEAIGFDSPCVVMLHRDGGTITLFDDMNPVLVRALPPVTRQSPRPDLRPSPAQWRQWRDKIADEIDATLEYYGRLTNDQKFADRISEQSPILFGGSLFEILGESGLNSVELLGQWSAGLNRPVALWRSELEPGHATATSLAMLPCVGGTQRAAVRRTLQTANLLPAAFELNQRFETVRLRWSAGLIIGLIITVMFGVDGYIVQRERHADQRRRQEVIEPIRDHVRQLQTVERECLRDLEHLQTIATHRPNDEALQALAAIAAAIPHGNIDLHHTELDFVSGQWSFAGVAKTEEALLEMAQHLRQSNWIETPKQHEQMHSVIVSTERPSDDSSPKNRRDGSEWFYELDGRFRWDTRLTGPHDQTIDRGNDE